MMVLQSIELTIPTTSYANSGGTGDRTASITATSNQTWASSTVPARVVNGSFTANPANCLDMGVASAAANTYIRFDFGAATLKYIDEMKIYYDRLPANASWKIQASNDASTWADLATFTWNTATQTVSLTGVDAAGYRYYQMLWPLGGVPTNGFFEEIEFKIAPGAT